MKEHIENITNPIICIVFLCRNCKHSQKSQTYRIPAENDCENLSENKDNQIDGYASMRSECKRTAEIVIVGEKEGGEHRLKRDYDDAFKEDGGERDLAKRSRWKEFMWHEESGNERCNVKGAGILLARNFPNRH
jgi:hypothetical protein